MKSKKQRSRRCRDPQTSAMLNEKGSFAYFVVFAVLMVFGILFFSVYLPFGQLFLTETYSASEDLIARGEIEANQISDANVKTALLNTFATEKAATPDMIDVLSVFYQYGWLLIPFIVVMVLFLASRRQVESGGGIK